MPCICQLGGGSGWNVLVEQHQFAIAARADVAEADHRMGPALPHDRHRGYPPPNLHLARAAGTIVQHLADIFVAGHERPGEIERRVWPAELLGQLDDVAPALEEVLVRSAQAAAMRAHQRLARGLEKLAGVFLVGFGIKLGVN